MTSVLLLIGSVRPVRFLYFDASNKCSVRPQIVRTHLFAFIILFPRILVIYSTSSWANTSYQLMLCKRPSPEASTTYTYSLETPTDGQYILPLHGVPSQLGASPTHMRQARTQPDTWPNSSYSLSCLGHHRHECPSNNCICGHQASAGKGDMHIWNITRPNSCMGP